MATKKEYSRLLVKRSNSTGVVPTINGTSPDEIDNTWVSTDILKGEIYANVADNKLWIRTYTGIYEIYTASPSSLSPFIKGSTGTYSIKANNNTAIDATANYATAIGNATLASGLNSFACGGLTTASGANSITGGFQTTASGNGSAAFGSSTQATNTQSFACGNGTLASGQSAFASGLTTTASGNYSFASGANSIASGTYSSAFNSSTAIGNYSFACGSGTQANGLYSHTEGQSTIANGAASHAEGNSTTASGLYSHAEGNICISGGNYSHAEGNNTVTAASGAHAEGELSAANGVASHAEGYGTNASGKWSHAGGGYAIALRTGEWARSSMKGTQSGRVQLGNVTTNATATELFVTGDLTSLPVSTERFVLNQYGYNVTMNVDIRIMAYNPITGDSRSWTAQGIIKYTGTTCSLVSAITATSIANDTALSTTSVAITADNTNKSLLINCTGVLLTTLRWTAIVNYTMVTAIT